MKCPNTHPDNNSYCPSEGHMNGHDTDCYSTFYCESCGYEEKVTWPAPVKVQREKFNSPTPPRNKPQDKKRRRD